MARAEILRDLFLDVALTVNEMHRPRYHLNPFSYLEATLSDRLCRGLHAAKLYITVSLLDAQESQGIAENGIVVEAEGYRTSSSRFRRTVFPKLPVR